MKQYTVPFGKSTLAFSVPTDWQIALAQHRASLPSLAMPRPNFDFAAELSGIERVVIVFTDATRHCPDQRLAEAVLMRLREQQFPIEQVAFLCAVGMHRPSTHSEKTAKLGESIVSQFEVRDHDPMQTVHIGEIDGVPVEINPLLIQPGTLVVALGVVEPHQYAGFSGGAKTAVIGCGGPGTIAATHGPRFLDQSGTRLGRIDGNPFQQFVRKAGKMIGLKWASNVLLNSAYEIVDQYAGPPDTVHDALVARARQLYETPVDSPYDVVIAGVGAPKDANLYQASRAATYIGLSDRPVIRPGGVIILPAPLPEGAGQGQGEQNFFAALKNSTNLDQMMAAMQQHGCRPGEQRAYMIAQLLQQYHVIVVSAPDPELIRAAHMTPAATMPDALALTAAQVGDSARALLVPHALQTIPVPV